MYNFRVVPNDGQYRVCAHPFKLFFTSGTTSRQVDLAKIPLKSYEFKIFEDIINCNYDPNMLIGELVSVLFKLVLCSLIFHVWMHTNTSFTIDVIGVVEEVKFQLPNGNAARVDFNLKDLKKPGLNRHKGSDFSELDRFLYKSKVLNLSHIRDAADGTNFCTIGTTAKLIAWKGGSFYHSCGRYRVEIMFCHRKGSTTFVFWYRDCTKVIGMFAANLRTIMIQASFGIEIGVAKITKPSCYKTQASQLELSQIKDLRRFDQVSENAIVF
ncbi:hypothetical protein JHK82_028011 [Glycine max]|nr:hypothetical protein JHK82_028011 [Glycine max]